MARRAHVIEDHAHNAARCASLPELGSAATGSYCLYLDLCPEWQGAGIPLMYRVPFSSLPRLNGKPAGRPGPELIRLIVMTDLSCYLHSRYLRDRRT